MASSRDGLNGFKVSFLHIFKGNVGPGCLSLPYAFSQMPRSLALSSVICLAALTSFNSLILTRLVPSAAAMTTYVDLGRLYDDLNSAGGRALGQRIVKLSILMQQLSICCVYFSFVADNMANLSLWGGSLSNRFRQVIIMSAMYPLVAVWVSRVRSLSDLAMVSKYATIVLLFSFLVVVLTTSCGAVDVNDGNDGSDGSDGSDGNGDSDYNNNIHQGHNDGEYDRSATFTSGMLGFSAILYSFEGVCLVLPVYNSMPQKERFPTVFLSAISTVAATYVMFGFYCMETIGKVDNGSITAFMSAHASGRWRWLIETVNALLAGVVLATYPLQFFPVSEIIEESAGISADCGSNFYEEIGENEFMGDDKLENNNAESSGNDNVVVVVVAASSIQSEDVREVAGSCEPVKDAESVEEMSLVKDSASGRSRKSSTNSIVWKKVLLVTLTYLLAMLIPSLSLLMSLAGSLAGSLVALILPGLLYIGIKGNSFLMTTLVVTGVAVMVAGASASITEMFRQGFG